MMAPQTSERAPAAHSSIDRTIERIETLVERETEALRSRTPIDLRESNNGKSQALLELELAMRSLRGMPPDAELVRRIKALRAKLEVNRAVLLRHLEAVREIASVVAETIQASEWDGTYTQYVASASAPR